mmetsp:Transcript_36118/g.82288  ORF Transcript_36118/g.82288 Transcript_36118/m.82288 type:complete len:260 (+) Transcript_36118:465-1244(+)
MASPATAAAPSSSLHCPSSGCSFSVVLRSAAAAATAAAQAATPTAGGGRGAASGAGPLLMENCGEPQIPCLPPGGRVTISTCASQPASALDGLRRGPPLWTLPIESPKCCPPVRNCSHLAAETERAGGVTGPSRSPSRLDGTSGGRSDEVRGSDAEHSRATSSARPPCAPPVWLPAEPTKADEEAVPERRIGTALEPEEAPSGGDGCGEGGVRVRRPSAGAAKGRSLYRWNRPSCVTQCRTSSAGGKYDRNADRDGSGN